MPARAQLARRMPLPQTLSTTVTSRVVATVTQWRASGGVEPGEPLCGGGGLEAFRDEGGQGRVVLFARNRLCALVRPGLAVEPATILDRMLDANVKLGTSTPRADPSGDYAWEVFRKADRLRPGAFAALEEKALRLTGGPNAPSAPPGRTIYGALVAAGKADIFLTYCTSAREAQTQNSSQQIVPLPVELAVGADYGLTVLNSSSPQAYEFAMFILSIDGQRVLAKHGFAAPALPQ